MSSALHRHLLGSLGGLLSGLAALGAVRLTGHAISSLGLGSLHEVVGAPMALLLMLPVLLAGVVTGGLTYALASRLFTGDPTWLRVGRVVALVAVATIGFVPISILVATVSTGTGSRSETVAVTLLCTTLLGMIVAPELGRSGGTR